LSFDTVVYGLPMLPTDLSLEGCGTLNLNDAVSGLDSTLSFSFYDNEENAQAGIDAIQSPEAFVANGTNSEVYVRAENSNDCLTVGRIAITVVDCDIPKGISPNGDDYNEAFDLSNFDVEELSVYNRYGRAVYSMKNYSNEWHGQSDKHEELPTGTYYYYLNLKEGKSKTGWVYINREIN
jgi:gliding motility-associated-like protein